MKVRKHVWIRGELKGTFFRLSLMSQAKLLAITGWVRNVYDGLECMFEGDEEMVHDMIEFCRSGPDNIIIKEVQVEEGKYRAEFKEFAIRDR